MTLNGEEKAAGHHARTPFSAPRDFLDNRFVYVVISSRARGLSVGVNMNPDKLCNFNCAYCEVNRLTPSKEQSLDIDVMAGELERTLELISSGELLERPAYAGLNRELMQLRHVALSGDGEPTLCPNFAEAVQAVTHVRARSAGPFFKFVLITNGTGLDSAPVKAGLKHFTSEDEIWVKIDAGTQDYMDRVNRSTTPLEKILANALEIGRQRPIVIQSLFPLIAGKEPAPEEIQEYIHRLSDLKKGGAQISLVQIYSATRPTPHSECAHMPLRSLSRIRQSIHAETGLKAEVF